MNNVQVQDFVMRYLEATKCHIIEKSTGHITVKLSPEADRQLTNRSYYWSFVERTGVEPETMTYSFRFDPLVEEDLVSKKVGAEPADSPVLDRTSHSLVIDQASLGIVTGQAPQSIVPDQSSDSILGRYFGFVPTPLSTSRVLNETVTFGSRRLDQFFYAAKSKGKFVHLFEEPKQLKLPKAESSSYYSWFAVNFNVSLSCDMKRDELHSLGISLSTGKILSNFHQLLQSKKLTPKLPAHTYLRESISLPRALVQLENHLEKLIKSYDHKWAKEAHKRLQDELYRIDQYYLDLIQSAENEKKAEAAAQYQNRKEEIAWQYRPRIQASLINCGLFHLEDDSFHPV